MKKIVMHTIIVALALLAVGGTISVLDADWKENAKKGAIFAGKTVASAGILATCAYPASYAAMFTGILAQQKLINYLEYLRVTKEISNSAYKQLVGGDAIGCPDIAGSTVALATFLLTMSPAMYYVYKLWSSKKNPETIPTTPATETKK